MLCIGDPDQAIYGFRGADRSLFFSFRDEVGARTFTLPLNYRSVPAIVQAGAGIIGDRRAVPLPPVAVRPGRDRVRVFAAGDPADEAGFIASAIDRLVGGVDSVAVDALRGAGGGRSFADFAVLFRTRAVRDALLPGFERAGLPFTFREDSPVTADEPWRTVAAALRFLGNPADRVALAEILGGPPAPSTGRRAPHWPRTTSRRACSAGWPRRRRSRGSPGPPRSPRVSPSIGTRCCPGSPPRASSRCWSSSWMICCRTPMRHCARAGRRNAP